MFLFFCIIWIYRESIRQEINFIFVKAFDNVFIRGISTIICILKTIYKYIYLFVLSSSLTAAITFATFLSTLLEKFSVKPAVRSCSDIIRFCVKTKHAVYGHFKGISSKHYKITSLRLYFYDHKTIHVSLENAW